MECNAIMGISAAYSSISLHCIEATLAYWFCPIILESVRIELVEMWMDARPSTGSGRTDIDTSSSRINRPKQPQVKVGTAIALS